MGGCVPADGRGRGFGRGFGCGFGFGRGRGNGRGAGPITGSDVTTTSSAGSGAPVGTLREWEDLERRIQALEARQPEKEGD